MKAQYLLPILMLAVSLISCQDNLNKPSIKDNSTRNLVKETVNDYSDVPSEKLYKHILAHFDLGDYKLGKEKLKSLMSSRPDLIDSLDLNTIKANFDEKLADISEKELAIAEKERKLRMPNAVKNMRIQEKGNLSYYLDNTSPEFDSTESFHAYFTKNKAGIVELYLKIRYISTDWLNIENYMITVDQLDYNLSGTVQKTETKGKKKYKHEVLDVAIDSPEKLTLLQAVANGEEVSAAYIGESSYKKREITKEQQLAVRNVIDAYLFMGGMNLKDLQNRYTNLDD